MKVLGQLNGFDPWRLGMRRRDARLADLSSDDARQLRAAQLGAVFRLTPTLLTAQVINLATILLIFRAGRHDTLLTVWGTAIWVLFCLWFVSWRGRGSAPARKGASVRGVRRLTLHSAALGALWSVPIAVLFGDADPTQRMVLASLTTGLVAGGALAMATVWQAAFAFTLAVMAPSLLNLASLARAGDPTCIPLIAMALSLVLVIARIVRERSELFVESYLANVGLRSQGQVIGMLLNDFEEGASDFLWETDADARLKRVSNRLAQLLGKPQQDLEGADFAGLLSDEAQAVSRHGTDLGTQLATREAFRDHLVGLTVGGKQTLWSITGKPVLDSAGAFQGFRGVGSDVTDADRVANFDVLTGLPNRALFQRQVEGAADRLRGGDAGFALLILDLDRFKQVNDTFGHATGDAILCAVAARISGCLGPKDLATRFGGDEFCIFRDGGAPADARALGERLIEEISRSFEIQEYRIQIGASIGVAVAPADGTKFDALLRNSDLALYRAKSDGRAALRFFDSTLDEARQARRRLEADLRGALGAKELSLHFQPIVDIRSGAVAACEALLRWRHPELGAVSPAQFIPLAEKTGLIVAIGEWVLAEACRAAAAWPRETRVAVNVSPVQFRARGFDKAIENALASSGLSPRRLEIEITESVFIENWTETRGVLERLQALGVCVSIDDFGTGYSSLSVLADITADEIKVDRSFITAIHQRPRSQSVLRTIESLGLALGMSIVAEGIETFEELAYLQATSRIRYGQGFYFSKPFFLNEIKDARELFADGRSAEATRTTAQWRNPLASRKVDGPRSGRG